MGIYLIPRDNMRNMKAAADLVVESGGRVLHLAPIIGGLVVEASTEVADLLDLLPWK